MPISDRAAAMLALGLASCSGQPVETPQNLQQTRPVAARTAAVETIPCARGTAPLAPVCTLDRERTATGQRWTVRFPDGGFRRLTVTGDEIETADGAELLHGRGSDAVVADEHYRLPTR